MKTHSGCTTKGTHTGDSVFPSEDNVSLRNMEDYGIFVKQAVEDKIINAQNN